MGEYMDLLVGSIYLEDGPVEDWDWDGRDQQVLVRQNKGRKCKERWLELRGICGVEWKPITIETSRIYEGDPSENF